ncbi:flagellar biosynthesis protein FlhF [Brevibacillus sp. TJ4]|uniref:flagellar biosynthesis protein FlhF n=1 Tax=Brevibacillus sp. TJ4 TaxID=3234853 RepID=UPI0037CDC23F
MRVKRYIVDSMPEAMEKIRGDLGKDAVILNSKPIKVGGVFGLFGKQRIEVIAAVDAKTADRDRPVPPAAERSNDSLKRPPAGTYTAQQVYRKPSSATPGHESPAEPAAAPRAMLDTAPPVAEPAGRAAVEQPAGQTSQTARVSAQPVPDTVTAGKGSEQLANEVRDMRKMFEKLLVNDLSQQLSPSLQQVRQRLLEQEVSEEVSAEIIGHLVETAKPGHDWSREEALRISKEQIAAMLAPHIDSAAKLGPDVRYAFFFGPTGVGKTTTIAKLAANSMLKERRKIGFITADTYRMAAIEQLKTYANILNVPLEVVFSPREMAQAMEKLSDCDLIFVDTAGRNFRNDEYVQGISELLQHGNNNTNFLVLSLTSKYRDMKAIIDNFAGVPVDQIIFTKADETNAYGSMLNVTKETGLSLSYMTTGQNVPDDIMAVTPAMVSAMIMGD